MRRWTATVSGILGLLFSAESCNQVGDIREGIPRGDDPVVTCSNVADCAKVESAECRVPVGCERGLCTYGDAIDGTVVKTQVPGDCTEIVCDGSGKTRLVPHEADVFDDGNVCTLDTCAGTTPVHTVQTELPCYTGPAGTKGKGACVEGTQRCDAQGNAVGGCEDEVVPKAETCISPKDEDCDGKANEEGEGCVCVPDDQKACYTGPAGTQGVGACHGGMQSCKDDGLGYGPCAGEKTPDTEACDAGGTDEDCDGEVNEGGPACVCGDGYVSGEEECEDGNLDSSDACTNLCKAAVCGDSFVQPGLGETCDDGGTSGGDTCSPTCQDERDVLQVVGGDTHTCALLDGGIVKCWGLNSAGQLGLGDTIPRGVGPNQMGGQLPAVDLGLNKTALAIAAGGEHTCALLNDGSIKCWGQNSDGQLGQGDIDPRGNQPNEMGDNLLPVDLGAGKTASAIIAGYYHTCARLNDGSVKCWGNNVLGQLGLGLNDILSHGDEPNEMGDNLPAVNLGTGKIVSGIAAGFLHTCALLSDGSVKCWGYNDFGQLGLGNSDSLGHSASEMGDNLLAVDLGTGKTASKIDAGEFHTCAVLNDNSVKCWGSNGFGQLGQVNNSNRGDSSGEMGDNLPAINLGTGQNALGIAVGNKYTCAVVNGGGVKCWGLNAVGQLGLGNKINLGAGADEMGDNLPAVALGMGKTALAVDTGGFHTCALLSDGGVKCWGANDYGQLGLDSTGNRGDELNEMSDNLPTTKLFSPYW